MDAGFAILTVVMAVIGAVTGVTGLVLSVLNFQRDEARLRVTVEIGRLAGSGD